PSGPSLLSSLRRIEGIPFTGATPPDPEGAVGRHHFIQMVNGSDGATVAIYAKDGRRLAGPFALGSLWPNTTQPCALRGLGDPIVVYDGLADRFVLTQLAEDQGVGY